VLDTNNRKAPPNNRLSKVQPLIDILINKYNNALIPEKNVCIDESMVPFLGNLSFREYIANKTHRYGIKLFKLCTRDFYISQYKIYTGKEAVPGQLVNLLWNLCNFTWKVEDVYTWIIGTPVLILQKNCIFFI
jgi:hypothetical protein